MSKENIRAQIEAMPEGRKRELAKYMNTVYEDEADVGWEVVGSAYYYDLLDAPIWEPLTEVASDARAITQSQHARLSALRDRAGGWFYLKDGKVIFATLAQWKDIKGGWREP